MQMRQYSACGYQEAHQRIRDVAPNVVVTMPLHNAVSTVRDSVESVIAQQGVRGRWLLLVLDDSPTGCGGELMSTVIRDIPTLVVKMRCGSAAASRNQLLRLARQSPRSDNIIVRLDSDDVLADRMTVARLQRAFRRSVFSLRCGLRRPPDALVASNLQRRGRNIVGRNVADGTLLNRHRLVERLEGMASGDLAAELPSCNVVLGPNVSLQYPRVSSAEDHWLTVGLLVRRQRYRISVDGDILHTIYSLDGAATRAARRTDAFSASRRRLLAWAKFELARSP